jgi:hypothetical protein
MMSAESFTRHLEVLSIAFPSGFLYIVFWNVILRNITQYDVRFLHFIVDITANICHNIPTDTRYSILLNFFAPDIEKEDIAHEDHEAKRVGSGFRHCKN